MLVECFLSGKAELAVAELYVLDTLNGINHCEHMVRIYRLWTLVN